MSERKAVCGNCKFWHLFAEDRYHEGDDQGDCEVCNEWTYADDFCAEHQPKEAE